MQHKNYTRNNTAGLKLIQFELLVLNPVQEGYNPAGASVLPDRKSLHQVKQDPGESLSTERTQTPAASRPPRTGFGRPRLGLFSS